MELRVQCGQYIPGFEGIQSDGQISMLGTSLKNSLIIDVPMANDPERIRNSRMCRHDAEQLYITDTAARVQEDEVPDRLSSIVLLNAQVMCLRESLEGFFGTDKEVHPFWEVSLVTVIQVVVRHLTIPNSLRLASFLLAGTVLEAESNLTLEILEGLANIQIGLPSLRP